MTEALWLLAGFGTWFTACWGIDRISRTKKKLEKAERRVSSLRLALHHANMDKERQRAQYEAKIAQLEITHQVVKDSLQSQLLAERTRCKWLVEQLQEREEVTVCTDGQMIQ